MRRKFHNETYGANDSFNSYISRTLSYQERLANTRQELSDDDVIDSSLPPSFQTTKEMIFNQQTKTISSTIAALHRHAEIVQTGPPEPTSGATHTRGLFAGQPHPHLGCSGYGRFNRGNRGNRGNYGGNNRGSNNRSNKEDLCWYCSKKGHRQQS